MAHLTENEQTEAPKTCCAHCECEEYEALADYNGICQCGHAKDAHGEPVWE